jgi:hypothetical protein
MAYVHDKSHLDVLMKLWILYPLIVIWALLALAEADELVVISSVHSDFSKIQENNLRNLYLGSDIFEKRRRLMHDYGI